MTVTSAKCDGDGQFRGRSVAIIAAIVVLRSIGQQQCRKGGWKRPMRGGQEDVTATSAKCDGDGQFRGRSVAIIAAIVVFIVRRPPQGRSSCWREATSK